MDRIWKKKIRRNKIKRIIDARKNKIRKIKTGTIKNWFIIKRN